MDKYQAIAEEFSENMISLTQTFESKMKQQIEDMRREAEGNGTMSERELRQFDKALISSGIAEMFGISVDEEGLDEIELKEELESLNDEEQASMKPAAYESHSRDYSGPGDRWHGGLGIADVFRDD